LTLIEEHGVERLDEDELYDLYCQADDFLKDTQDFEVIKRLRACARLVSKKLRRAKSKAESSRVSGPKQSELTNKSLSLPEAIHSFEAKLIEEALRVENGSVSRAAKRLGIKHQSLVHLLNTRHSNLLVHRTPMVKRKRNNHAM
jgi:DNA-binding NtrC family response regulator